MTDVVVAIEAMRADAKLGTRPRNSGTRSATWTSCGRPAEGWVTYVSDALGEIAGTLGLDKMRTTIEWEGRAARAYQATVPPQVAGLNAIKDVADQMRSSLNSLASALEGFWIAIGFAFAGFVAGSSAHCTSAFDNAAGEIVEFEPPTKLDSDCRKTAVAAAPIADAIH